MDPVRPSDNLMIGLLNRECGNIWGSTHSLCSKIDQLVRSHIMGDVFFAYQHDLGLNVHRVIRNHDLVAYKDLNKIVLFDLATRNQAWDCKFLCASNMMIDQLKVSSDGIVLVITKFANFAINRKRVCNIFFEGNQVGTFEIDASAYTLKVVNDKIYVLMLKEQMTKFCTWDIKGDKLSEILLDEFSGVTSLSLTHGGFYLVATGVASMQLDIPIKVFVYDLITSSTQIFDFAQTEFRCQILSVKIHKDRGVLGITYHKMVEGFAFERPKDPKIIEINIFTGKIEAEHQLNDKSGRVEKLVVSDDHIVFLLIGSSLTQVWSIDRRNCKQANILTIPFPSDGINIQMTIFGKFLHVCYPEGSVIREKATNIHCVFNLSHSQIVKKVSYKRYAWNTMTFQEGKLLIVNNNLGIKDCLYVEDFLQVDGNSEQNKVAPEMWQRHGVSE